MNSHLFAMLHFSFFRLLIGLIFGTNFFQLRLTEICVLEIAVQIKPFKSDILKFYLTDYHFSFRVSQIVRSFLNSLFFILKCSHSKTFFKISALKNFVIFTEKYLLWSLFLIKLEEWRSETLLKRGSSTVVFL